MAGESEEQLLDLPLDLFNRATGRRDYLRAKIGAVEAPTVPALADAPSPGFAWWTSMFALVLHRYSGAEAVSLRTADGVCRLAVHPDDSVEALVRKAVAAVSAPRPPVGSATSTRTGVSVSIVTSDADAIRLDSDLALVVNGIDAYLVADSGLWDADTIERMAKHVAYAAAAQNEADITVGAVSLLDDEERRTILEVWNDTAADWPGGNYLELLRDSAATRPDAPAVVQGSEVLSFGQLEALTNQISRYLQRQGAQTGERIGLFANRSTEFIVGVLGILKTGATALLLDPANPDARLAEMIGDAQPLAVLGADNLSHRLLGVARVAIDPATFAAESSERLAVEISAETVSHLIFTSGSTGRPKGVLERHGALANLVHWTRRAYDVRAGDRASWLSTPGFAVQVMEWMPYLALGVAVHIPGDDRSMTPEQARDWLVEQGITHTMLVAAMAERAWKLPWPSASRLRVMVTTAERVHSWPPADAPYQVVMTYGSTETTHALSCLDLGAGIDLTASATPLPVQAARPVPVGRPIANMRAYILDAVDQPVPVGAVGRLHLAGAGLSAGYFDRPELTATKFRANPLPEEPSSVLYDSGDLARYRSDGAIEILGRTDGQVKIRGNRVEVGEVESCLSRAPGVAEVAVLTHQAAPGDLRLVSYVAPETGVRCHPADIRDFAAGQLPHYMVPAYVVVLDRLPRLPNGKLDRQRLPQPNVDTRDGVSTEYVAPGSNLENRLAVLWQKVLRLESIGTADSFFELGGHSLLAFQLLESMRQEFGFDLTLVDLNRHPTIAGLASLMSDIGMTAPAGALGLPVVTTDPAHRFDPFPLNDSQQALWVGRGDSVELGNVGCHGYFEWESDQLDIGRFRAAWRQLVLRHESLRTVIRPSGVQQVLAEPPAYPIEVADLRYLPVGAAHERMLAIREELAHQVMADDQWPLFDVRLTLLPGEGGRQPVRIHLSLDMLIADAWSYFTVLVPDLVQLYEQPDHQLPPLELTFRDYVLCVGSELESSQLYQRAKQYWLDRLADMPSAPQLPARPDWEPKLPVRFDRLDHRLDQARWAALKAQAQQFGVTASCLLAGVFAEVLRRWSGQDRFVINFPLFNRLQLHPEINSIIGDTTTTLLLAAEKSDGTFTERAQALQEQLWSDLEHRHFSGVRVIRELTRLRGGTVEAMMPIVLTSLLGHPPRHFTTALGHAVYSISQTPQVSIDFQIYEIAGELQFNWDYLPAQFPTGLIEEMFEAYCGVLHVLAASPAAWSATEFDLIPKAQSRLRDQINQTEQPLREVMLHELLAQQASAQPQAPALISGDRQLTYAQLWSAACHVASRLQAVGVRRGELVGVVLPKGWQQYVAVYGILIAGGAYLPIDPQLPAARQRLMLELGGVEVAFGPQDLPTVRRLVIDDDLLTAEASAVTPSDAEPSDLAYVLYTSGSTGEPKGVMVDHRGVVNHLDEVNRRFGIGTRDRAMATANLHFDMSVYDVFGILAAGGSVVLPEPGKPDPDGWLALAGQHQVTFWAAVPALMEMVVNRAEAVGHGQLGDLRTVVLAGDWIPLQLPDRLRALAPQAQVISCGGPTETINWSICYPIGDVDQRWTSIPYGKPMANHRYYILDEKLRECPHWVPGQMYDASEVGLSRGYLRDPLRTAQSFVVLPSGERAYATGDRGRYMPDGEIEILGRVDFQVKVRGYRIELGEIEAALRSHPSVDEAVVVAVGEHARRQLVAHVTGEAGLVVAELSTHLSGLLAAHMVPEHIVVRESLPLSSNGKIDRKTLIAAGISWPPADQETNAPADPMDPVQQAIASVWTEILGAPSVSATDRFFDLGGNSMTAALVAAQLSEVFDVDITLRTIFDMVTVAELAAALRADPERGQAVVAAAERLAASR